MRVLSVVPLNFRVCDNCVKRANCVQPEQWTGPLSRELLVFNSFVKSTTKALRQLLEALNVHILLSGDARRMRDDYLDMCISMCCLACYANPRPSVPERHQHWLRNSCEDVS